MAAVENLREVQERVQATRQRLEGLAERAARLSEQMRGNLPLVASLQRLANLQPLLFESLPERWEGDDGAALQDAWEISLINEEGK